MSPVTISFTSVVRPCRTAQRGAERLKAPGRSPTFLAGVRSPFADMTAAVLPHYGITVLASGVALPE
jgi:hypothetical protein